MDTCKRKCAERQTPQTAYTEMGWPLGAMFRDFFLISIFGSLLQAAWLQAAWPGLFLPIWTKLVTFHLTFILVSRCLIPVPSQDRSGVSLRLEQAQSKAKPWPTNFQIWLWKLACIFVCLQAIHCRLFTVQTPTDAAFSTLVFRRNHTHAPMLWCNKHFIASNTSL